MASTTFTANLTRIGATWLNEVNTLVHGIFGGATTDSEARTNLGLGSIATQDANGVAITGGSITGITDLAASGANTDITSVYLSNTGLKVKDTNASHGLSIVPGSDITADRTLTVTTGDASRTVTLSGDLTVSSAATISGTNTGDQAVATQADMEAASSTTAVVTPGRAQYHPGVAKAWINFNGTGTVATRASHNVSSITDNGTGDYTVNFTTAMSSANWVPAGYAGDTGSSAGFGVTGATSQNQTTAGLRFSVKTYAGADSDAALVSLVCFGDQ